MIYDSLHLHANVTVKGEKDKTILKKADVAVSALALDGDFGDWSSVDKFGTYVQASSVPIAISEWAVASDGSRLFLYVNAEGAVMSTSEVSSFYLFVDSDNSESTGYNVSGIGADYLLQIDGWNGSVQSATVSASRWAVLITSRRSTDRPSWR
jgi:hypothetical protein